MWSLQVVATDDDPLTYGLTDAPVGMTISPTGLIEWTPDLDDSGSYIVTITVDDGFNPPVGQQLEIDVLQLDGFVPLYRVNTGGYIAPAIDTGYPDWDSDFDDAGAIPPATLSPYYSRVSQTSTTTRRGAPSR